LQFSMGFSFLFCQFTGKSIRCNQVIQSPPVQEVALGREVTLFCEYKTNHGNPDLYWYRVKPDSSIQFVLYRDNSRFVNAPFAKDRFSVQRKTRTTFNLVISEVEPGDGGLYYCALDTEAQVFWGALHKPLLALIRTLRGIPCHSVGSSDLL
uniref:Ig-like domain-containing protein n=1 Tax=Monodelphis domestica TaxID=13616 RepID=F7CEY5_MONDO